jgi:hypothetical protein
MFREDASRPPSPPACSKADRCSSSCWSWSNLVFTLPAPWLQRQPRRHSTGYWGPRPCQAFSPRRGPNQLSRGMKLVLRMHRGLAPQRHNGQIADVLCRVYNPTGGPPFRRDSSRSEPALHQILKRRLISQIQHTVGGDPRRSAPPRFPRLVHFETRNGELSFRAASLLLHGGEPYACGLPRRGMVG